VAASNPFRFGALALDQAFTNRDREIKELTADILNGQDVVLFGPRRYGKSSLILKVIQGLSSRKVLVGYCDLSTTPTKEKLAEKLSQTVYEDFASVLDRVRERTLALFRGLRIQPQITLDPTDASVSFGFDTGHAPADVDATIETLLALPGRLAGERGRRAALVLDEFQEITEIDRDYPKLMRAVFQTQPEVAHIYLGSKRHLMRRIFNDENEPFWRSAKQMELGLIARDDFATFLRARCAETGRPIDDAALARLLDLTGGHPYATQELAYFVWEEVGSRRRTTLDAVERGLERLLDSEDSHFSLVWEGSTRNERLLLVALAAERGRPFSQDFRRRHRLPPPTNIQKALVGLVRRELVAKGDDGLYRLSEPFLREWLLRTQR
jgi:AAA+ ATPase superfamily predicted ATPase